MARDQGLGKEGELRKESVGRQRRDHDQEPGLGKEGEFRKENVWTWRHGPWRLIRSYSQVLT